MVDVRYLVDIANVSAGEVVPQTQGTAEWLSQRGLVEILAPEPAPQIASEEPAPEPPKRRPGRPRKTEQ